MHPCWALRRLSVDNAKKEGKCINCVFTEKTFTCVSIGAAGEGSVSMTVSVSVPVVTNSMPIKAGEELILELVSKKPAEKRSETWKDDVKKSTKKAKAAPSTSSAHKTLEV